jgi:hypothetical protein
MGIQSIADELDIGVDLAPSAPNEPMEITDDLLVGWICGCFGEGGKLFEKYGQL